jgi:hypothetical protein
MPSGGARRSAGRPADPNAFRRDRKDDAEWVLLPAEGFGGDVPEWPLTVVSKDELTLWGALWRKPQAVMWDRLEMGLSLAAYVRAFLESVEPGASAGLKTAVLRMEGELGLSLPGMHSMRWKFSEDELAAKRDLPAAPVVSGARGRLKALADS